MDKQTTTMQGESEYKTLWRYYAFAVIGTLRYLIWQKCSISTKLVFLWRYYAFAVVGTSRYLLRQKRSISTDSLW